MNNAKRVMFMSSLSVNKKKKKPSTTSFICHKQRRCIRRALQHRRNFTKFVDLYMYIVYKCARALWVYMDIVNMTDPWALRLHKSFIRCSNLLHRWFWNTTVLPRLYTNLPTCDQHYWPREPAKVNKHIFYNVMPEITRQIWNTYIGVQSNTK